MILLRPPASNSIRDNVSSACQTFHVDRLKIGSCHLPTHNHHSKTLRIYLVDDENISLLKPFSQFKFKFTFQGNSRWKYSGFWREFISSEFSLLYDLQTELAMILFVALNQLYY